ncbi:GFA family protein [Aestuariibacter halophilus]|uniref:GFA family protein n=1 Tax=Fluctibacter halophilus TaxID=226011 RepID=A0ABS8GB28_9ALTE|nr:GFA family protein [Aestuariibacter halophilus]MCC2617797.1 GFA family protein [Aestuariibacter halophilus]
MTYHGSCLCGDVTFAITGHFQHFYLCHCQHCQKGSGSAHAANLFAPKATLTWLTGAENVRGFTVPGTRHFRQFCNRCGAVLPSLQMEGQLVVCPAGSLDSPLEQRPDAHLFNASKAQWDEDLASIPQFNQLPTENT